MTDIFSTHAPTGESSKVVVSPNEYSQEGRTIGYPTNFSVYVNKISTADGSASITESRTTSDLIGTRLYLYHRPLVQSSGSVSTISVSDGTLDTSLTNAKQGYVVFSSVPTANFTVTYSASPDCLTAWHLNTLQDDMMEVQKVLGVTNETGYPGLRNLAYGSFDSPLDANTSGVAQRTVYLSHLDQDIYIGSTSETSLTGERGVAHTIQIGREYDNVILEGTGIYLQQSAGTENVAIHLGNKTGDIVYIAGEMTGVGQVTFGGPASPLYSGATGGDVTAGVYNNSMLRVNGDASFLGNVYAVGTITVVNLTGTISSVVGSFSVTDALSVQGTTSLVGRLTTNTVTANQDITVNANIVAGNQAGAGGNGQTLVDGLDPSEIAHTYRAVTRKTLPNTVLNGRPLLTQQLPKQSFYTFAGAIDYTQVAGDYYQLTGYATSTSAASGAYPNVIQMNFSSTPLPIVSGSSYPAGTLNGVWSTAMMDPGALELYDINSTFKTPIYGYSLVSGDGTYVYKLDLYSPELDSAKPVTANDSLLLYNKYSRPYDYISAAGGASPTFAVYASSQFPLEIAFDDKVAKMTSSSSNISMTSALNASITGLSTTATGVAYIFAKASPDPENAPSFKARSVPFRMEDETAIGEVVASYNGSWTILETTSYRPGAVYDSSWLPVVTNASFSGRAFKYQSGETMFFSHNFGCDVDITRINAELYLGNYIDYRPNTWNHNQPLAYSMMTTDIRAGFGFSGMFTKVPLTNANYSGSPSFSSSREASLTYLDSRLIGIRLNNTFIEEIDSASAPTSIRLVVRRDS